MTVTTTTTTWDDLPVGTLVSMGKLWFLKAGLTQWYYGFSTGKFQTREGKGMHGDLGFKRTDWDR